MMNRCEKLKIIEYKYTVFKKDKKIKG